ncbi:hypothetical protein NT6N_07890 [Oceaniferula spumae]|uniref:DUF1795 domain-containing protein n=1 Tax=Oceaniferula spumae TaxID=2979115 RepID=A0AAT9FIF5_9BACT
MKPLLILPAAALMIMPLTSCKDSHTASSGADHGKHHLATYEVAGLKLELPSSPAIGDVTLPESAKPLLESFQTYKSTDGTTRVDIVHAKYKSQDASVDGAADGAVAQLRAFPDVQSLSVNKNPVTVAGLAGRELELNYVKGGHPIHHHVLVFVRGNEMWQIQVISEAEGSAAAAKMLKDHVFGSVNLLD